MSCLVLSSDPRLEALLLCRAPPLQWTRSYAFNKLGWNVNKLHWLLLSRGGSDASRTADWSWSFEWTEALELSGISRVWAKVFSDNVTAQLFPCSRYPSRKACFASSPASFRSSRSHPLLLALHALWLSVFLRASWQYIAVVVVEKRTPLSKHCYRAQNSCLFHL